MLLVFRKLRPKQRPGKLLPGSIARARCGRLHHPGNVRSHAPDLAFGGAGGMVVMPQTIEAEVLHIASDQINGEHHPRELRRGASLRKVYAKYVVL